MPKILDPMHLPYFSGRSGGIVYEQDSMTPRVRSFSPDSGKYDTGIPIVERVDVGNVNIFPSRSGDLTSSVRAIAKPPYGDLLQLRYAEIASVDQIIDLILCQEILEVPDHDYTFDLSYLPYEFTMLSFVQISQWPMAFGYQTPLRTKNW